MITQDRFSQSIDLEQHTALTVAQCGVMGDEIGFEFAMLDDRAVRRNKMRKTLAELKNAAIAELERRGYDVRGKTPAQIRQILKRRSSKQKTDTQGVHQKIGGPR